jgi:hypothetical protein
LASPPSRLFFFFYRLSLVIFVNPDLVI